VLNSLDTLARGLGWVRPQNVPAPSAIPTTDDGGQIAAWGAWWDSIASQATLPPTSVLVERTPAPAGTWTSDLALANERAAPRAVTAYLGVQNALWQDVTTAWRDHSAGAAAQDALTNAQNALQHWWFTRVGGATGTLSPFPGPAGVPDLGGRAPVTPPSGSAGTSSGSTTSTVVKGAAALAAAYGISRMLRRRRRR
jgi:hypothetical protein